MNNMQIFRRVARGELTPEEGADLLMVEEIQWARLVHLAMLGVVVLVVLSLVWLRR